jgi:hypothetical protein
MSDTPAPQQTTDVRREGERGASLIFALFGLATLTILGLGLTSLGIVATKMTTNERDTQQALALADAGASHARKMVMFQEWPTNNLSHFLNGGDAVACNGDELSQAPAGAPSPPYPTLFIQSAATGGQPLGTGTYRVFVCDDHLTDVNSETNILDVNANVDVNKRILVRSIGTTAAGATAAIEQVYQAIPVPALLVNGNVELSGSVEISGSSGVVHANGQMEVSGNSVCAQQYFSATQTITGSIPEGGAGCNQDGELRPGSSPVNIRDLHPTTFMNSAQYRLTYALVPQGGGGGGGGNMDVEPRVFVNTNFGIAGQAANWQPAGSTLAGWNFQANQFSWSTNGNMPESIYYIETNVGLGGNIQDPVVNNQPAEMTVLALGWIDVGGGAKIQAHPGLNVPGVGPIALLAGTDIDMAGNGGGGSLSTFFGLVYCRHQLEMTGTPQLNGQVIALNAADTAFPMPAPQNQVNPSNPVTLVNGFMVISGTPNISWSGEGLTSVSVGRWRECRFDPLTFNAATMDPCGALSF